jgi:hypothetical protein
MGLRYEHSMKMRERASREERTKIGDSSDKRR